MTRNFKRILSLLLLFCLLSLQGFALEETDQPIEITVNNPGFETPDKQNGTFVKYWEHQSASAEDATFTRDTNVFHEGKSSLCIKNIKGQNPYVKQVWKNKLEPGAIYEFSVFIKANTIQDGRGAGVKLEFYSGEKETSETYLPADPSYPISYPNGQYINNTNNRWIQYRAVFHMPQEATRLRANLTLYGKGEAWYDDVSITLSGGPEKYSFDTDKVFHYKEEKDGYAHVKIDAYYKNKGIDTKSLVDFAVYKTNREDDITDDEWKEGKTDVAFSNLEAGFTYRTDYMVPYEKYILKCNIKDTGGALLEEHEQNLYVVDRPSMMSEDGYLTVDGKRFNPILGYHVNQSGKNYYDLAVDAGINTVQLTSTGAPDWQEMHNEGLKGILCLYRNKTDGIYEDKCAGSPYNLDRTIELVNKVNYGENGKLIIPPESIVGFAIMDEPFLSGDKPLLRDYCEKAYLEIRKVDKVHPIYICDKRNDRISAKYCDIYCIDSYAVGGKTRSVSRETRDAWDATKDKNGFWELAATYYVDNGTMATMNDARNSVYRAFEEGARGIGYYALCDGMEKRPGYEGKEELSYWEDWDALCKFNKEEAPILFDYFVNEKGTPFNDYDDGNDIDSVKWFSWLTEDDMYLAIHNRSADTKNITVPLQSKDGTVSVIGFKAEPVGLTTQSVQSGSGELSVTLASEEVALYKIIPQKEKITVQRSYEAENVTLVCAVYAHVGTKKELVTFSMTEETSKNGESINVSATIELPGTADGKVYTLEVVAWDMRSMKVIDEKTVLK